MSKKENETRSNVRFLPSLAPLIAVDRSSDFSCLIPIAPPLWGVVVPRQGNGRVVKEGVYCCNTSSASPQPHRKKMHGYIPPSSPPIREGGGGWRRKWRVNQQSWARKENKTTRISKNRRLRNRHLSTEIDS